MFIYYPQKVCAVFQKETCFFSLLLPIKKKQKKKEKKNKKRKAHKIAIHMNVKASFRNLSCLSLNYFESKKGYRAPQGIYKLCKLPPSRVGCFQNTII